MILERRIPIKYLFSLVKWELVFVTFFAIIVHFFSRYFIPFGIPIAIAGFLGTSIALIISFKLSQSYDRWWEARKVWGGIVNDSRNLVLQLRKFVRKSEGQAIRKIALRQVGWCYSLAFSLRSRRDQCNLDEFLSMPERLLVSGHKNLPLKIIDMHNSDLKELYLQGDINDFQYVQIDGTIVSLCNAMGKLERIKKTVFPKTYRVTLRFFIFIFLIILSISVTDLNSWIEIPLLVFISLPFFLLESISKNIQDPFENRPSDTPMLAISRTIEINIKQLLEFENIPDEHPNKEFFVD